MDWAWLGVRETWFESNVIPSNLGEGIWNNHGVRFWSCETMVNRSKLPGNYGASLLLPREQHLLSLVLWDLVLGLQFGEGIHHPVDEDLVLSLHNSVGLLPLHDRTRHQSRDCA